MNKLGLAFKPNVPASCLKDLNRRLSLSSLCNGKINHKDLRGVFPAVPTPFDDSGYVYNPGLLKNFSRWNQLSFSGYLVQGSNGEYPFLSQTERIDIVRTVRSLCLDKILIAGSGCESTQETIDLSNRMGDNGADVALVINPSYFKAAMTEAVLLRHYEEVANYSSIPIIIYNMPANTGINIPLEVISVMSEHPNCIGIKDSGGDVSRIGSIANLTARSEFSVLTGSAGLLLPTYLVGAKGCISALANVLDEEVCELFDLCEKADWNRATVLQRRLISPNTAITAKFGVAGLKATLDWIGLYGGLPRTPLLPLPVSDMDAVKKAFQTNGFFIAKV